MKDKSKKKVFRLPYPIRSQFWVVLLLFYTLFIAWILFLAYQHKLPLFFKIPLYDKLGHFYLLGMLGYLTHRAINRRNINLGHWILPIAPCLVLLLATIEEGLQILSPYRTFSGIDWLLSCAGIWAFWLLDHKTSPTSPKQRMSDV